MDTKTAKPSTVGEILQDEFLIPMGMTKKALAKALDMSLDTIDAILANQRELSQEEAKRLAQVFQVDESFWINIQESVNRWKDRS